MDTHTSQVSFIPKSPLAREDLFVGRRRPQSFIKILAITVFALTVGAYGGIFAYDLSLTKNIAAKIEEVRSRQAGFSASPEVAEARVFHARAEIMQELLEQHIVVSPIFEFLSENTLGRVFYSRFSFERVPGGGLTVELSGEAPGYATLAYQMDVLREKKKELSGVAVKDIVLTSAGSVTFALTLAFTPDYLSYVKANADTSAAEPVDVSKKEGTAAAPLSVLETSTVGSGAQVEGGASDSGIPADAGVGAGSDWSFSATSTDVAASAVSPEVATSTKKTWWSWFKFW